MKKPRILMLHRQATAVGEYRSWSPMRLLRRIGYDVFGLEGENYRALTPAHRVPDQPPWETWLRENLGRFDLLMVDRAVSHEEWGIFAGFRHYSPGCRMVVDFDDDFTAVPSWNKASAHCHPGQEMYEAGLRHLEVSELTTVSTATLAEKFGPKAHAILHAPNRIDPSLWEGHGPSPDRSADPCLRVLYGGADGHFGDLDRARQGLTSLIENPPVPWRLICFGAMPYWMHDLARAHPGRVVSLPWVPFTDYPAAVAWGGFDAAIAPLADNEFARAKSNIKWLEAAIQGIPFVCSRVGPYADIPAGCAIRVQNNPDEWREGLAAVLTDPALRASLVARAAEAVRDEWTIDRGRACWQNVVETALARPRIERLEDTVLPGRPTAPPAA